MSGQPIPQQEWVKIRRRYVLRDRHADRPTAVVELQAQRHQSALWRSFVLFVPWGPLDLPMVRTVCQWLEWVLRQELQDAPATPEGGQTP